MKRLLYAILLTWVSVISFNCQKEIRYSSSGIPGSGNTKADPVTATLQGNILEVISGSSMLPWIKLPPW